MSFDIFQFIERFVKKEIPDLATHNAYLGASILAGSIEFFGACLDTFPIAEESKSAARFCLAINELFPPEYLPFSRPAPFSKKLKPVHDLYTCLRCGMAHVLRPQGVSLVGSIGEAAANGHKHLDIVRPNGKDRPLIVVEQFRLDFVAAATELEKRLMAVPLDPKLQGDFLSVWTV